MGSEDFPEFLNHHCFIIGPVADVHLRHGIFLKDNQVRADAVEEPAIVADDEGDARYFLNILISLLYSA
jgi:hypothetical protein